MATTKLWFGFFVRLLALTMVNNNYKSNYYSKYKIKNDSS